MGWELVGWLVGGWVIRGVSHRWRNAAQHSTAQHALTQSSPPPTNHPPTSINSHGAHLGPVQRLHGAHRSVVLRKVDKADALADARVLVTQHLDRHDGAIGGCGGGVGVKRDSVWWVDKGRGDLSLRQCIAHPGPATRAASLQPPAKPSSHHHHHHNPGSPKRS